ncbi:hypothetical protein C8J56DRAFT_1052443 [Mycena floridula]|nr:hypothetical protein C8J56DRAFT_1052443 [Mycena floridula]
MFQPYFSNIVGDHMTAFSCIVILFSPYFSPILASASSSLKATKQHGAAWVTAVYRWNAERDLAA